MDRPKRTAPRRTTVPTSHRSRSWLLGVALAVAPLWARAEAPEPLTLARALELAARAPRLQARRAEIAEAQGRLGAAEVFPFDPAIDVEGAARLGADETSADFEVGLSQALPLGGWRSHRTDAARAEVAAARARARADARRLAAEVHLAFVDAQTARALRSVAEAERDLATRLLEVARKRLDAGAGTQLELNVAAAELARVGQRVAQAIGDDVAARAALAQALGLPADALPTPEGDVTAEAPAPAPLLPALLEEAATRRADLEALADAERAARARLEEARASSWPGITLRVFGGREENRDTLVGGGVELPLPVFDRNAGAVAEASAAAARATAEREIQRLDALREVVEAHARHEAAAEALRGLRAHLVGTFEESLALIEKSFAAGKATVSDVLLMRSAFFDAQRALVESAAAAARARVRLDVAAGRLALPPGFEVKE